MENIDEHDVTRNMLNTLRGGTNTTPSLNENTQANQPNKKVERLDEHDMTKKMLNRIRTSELNERQERIGQLLTEGDTDVVKVEDEELGEEAAKFNDMVGGVDFKQYEVYPQDRNVIMVGVLDNGIEFKFSKKEQAPYINANNLRLDSDTLDVIKKLQGYYVNWSSDWAAKISDYTQSV
jgi:hypothetical protein